MEWTPIVRDALKRHHPDSAVPDADVVEELAQHAAASYEAARAEGVSPLEARTRVSALIDAWSADSPRARRNPKRLPAVEAPSTTAGRWSGLAQDVRYGARRLRREPGFTLTALLLMALGIGAATTLGGLAYAVLIKPLPWPGADRLVLLTEVREGATRGPAKILTNATFLAWRDAPATLESLAAYSTSSATLTTSDDSERVRVTDATASLFDVLQTRAIEGRVFSADDEIAGRDHVVVLSFGLWQRRFGGKADALGQSLDIDGEQYRIVAVMPSDFEFPNRATQAWIPMGVPSVLSADPQLRSVSLFRSIGRLAAAATPAQAAAEGTARGLGAPNLGMVGTAVFGTQGPPRVSATPYLESLTSDVRPALSLLLAAVGLLLIAAVANVGGMQLARSMARRREVAIRAALGAGPVRLARQLLTEQLLLGLAGGVAGWMLALFLYQLLPHWLPPDFPRIDSLQADWRLLAGALVAAVIVSAISGSVPTFAARRLNVVEALVEDSLAPVGGSLTTRVGRLRAMVVTGQMAIATMLLVGAALLGRSFLAMQQVDRGYEPRNLLTATLPLSSQRFTGPQRATLLDEVLQRLAQVPGVVSVAAASVMPLLPYDQPTSFQIPAGPGRDTPVAVQADLRSVSPDYFGTLGMRIAEGRGFSKADTRTSLPVVVVNRTFAARYLSGPALGARLPLALDGNDNPWREIVGVVDDVRQRGATDPAQPEIFVPYRQRARGMDVTTPVIVLRTSRDPSTFTAPLRAIVHDVNGAVALDSIMSMDERVTASLAQPRLYAALLGAFAGFALVVAGTGLFGTLSYAVAQRSRELGVRAALGARPFDIVGLVIRQGLTTTAIGIAAGLAGALVLVRFVATLLYGVTTHDPLSLAGVAGTLLVIAGLACIAPALRAARIDPLTAMRRS